MHSVGFHVVNVFLHAVVCVLLLGVFRRGGFNHTTSLLATLLFAAHPIHTEAVSNVTAHPKPDTTLPPSYSSYLFHIGG